MPDHILDDISHRRYNPLRGNWLLVSPHRTKRPWQGQKEEPSKNKLPEYDPACYLCPRNARAAGDTNPDYKKTLIFVNDYSAVKEEQAEYNPPDASTDLASSLLRAESATGRCYVLTFSPKHHLTLADMTPAEIVPVIEIWTQIYASHLDPASALAKQAAQCSLPAPAPEATITPPKAQLRYMQIFENKGAAMGCSHRTPTARSGPLDDPRGATRRDGADGPSTAPPTPAATCSPTTSRSSWKRRSASSSRTRPSSSSAPGGPSGRSRSSSCRSATEDYAEAIQEVTRRYDNLFETNFPYSAGIHQAPLDATDEEADNSYLHMHFYPPLLRSATVRKFLVGYELMAEAQRDITPEQAAARLRNCGGKLYRDQLE
ncbi:galactose-1-phosphate uridylyltransferase [Verticillium alfalfae VaMs.102]|uniref:Galactose-1-phosphate uridylyltransferase n=1 Tax=Verticillium alfalfae (strain VaMs.102 / ATCC MYA-4576 / FGSC 10136) TaxID=526221 RepID=C9S5C0_VERA1|nr:galactose-1-phosphate uridylyltransferase [Verticillium alfalfae VaMs.102]EEY15028.1 galactose-1-phosphate uridylyltransferase [Verticillium alfalfae VaMs.102]